MRFVELFAVIGLMREALEPLGWRCVLANDNSPMKARWYKERWGEDDLVVADIREINSLPNCDLLTASFPCVDFSTAGMRGGLAARRGSSLIGKVFALIEAMRDRPRYVLLENVVGLLTLRDGSDLQVIIEYLAFLGYACDVVVLDAAHFTPQQRKRLFVVGELGSTTRAFIPDQSWLYPEALSGWIRARARTPLYPEGLPFRTFDWGDTPGTTTRLEHVLDHVPDESPLWNTPDYVDLNERLDDAYRGRLEDCRGRYSRGEIDGRIAVTYMRGSIRICEPGVMTCLLARPAAWVLDMRGGGERVRRFSPEELARLQGADGWPIPEGVSSRSSYVCFGDAVCVPCVRWLATHAFTFS